MSRLNGLVQPILSKSEEYKKESSEIHKKLIVHFRVLEDLFAFSKLIDQKLTIKTQDIFYPNSKAKGYTGTVYKKRGLLDLSPEKLNPAKKESWEKEWRGMPEFDHQDLSPLKTINIRFKTERALKRFEKLTGQTITDKTQSIWYPEAEITRMVDKRYIKPKGRQVNPRYPVYIISKGRWESRQTSKALEAMRVPYRIVIEPQEYDQYAAVIDKEKILVLPFQDLGKGSIPVRNWVWEHSTGEGFARHWVMDDNLDGFYRLNHNIKTPCASGAIFRAVEDFSDRYQNMAISGLNYFMFASRKSKINPITFNTRIYSCILMNNKLDHRWRGRYNEDTDISIRALQDGWCTALFNAFLAMKSTTMTMKGGNTEDL